MAAPAEQQQEKVLAQETEVVPAPSAAVVRQFCSSCKHLKCREDFSGRATCDECRPKKRKRCATAVTNKKAELDGLKGENAQLRQLLARMAAENEKLQELIFQDSQRLAKSQQEVQLLHAMLRGWQSGRRVPGGEIAGAPNGMMAPNGGMEGTPGMGGMGSGGMGMGSNVGAPFKRVDWHGGRHLLQAGLIEQSTRLNMPQHAGLVQPQNLAQHQHQNLRQMAEAVINTAMLGPGPSSEAAPKGEAAENPGSTAPKEAPNISNPS